MRVNKEGINFERDVPKGYRVALVIDAKSKKLALIFNLIAFLTLIPVMAIAFVPLLFNLEVLLEAEDVYFLPILLILITIVYTILHELTHGIAYKIQTGEKLTYGVSLSCAYCGVPKILTYRKTALIAVLAPTVVLSFVILPIMVAYYFVNAYIYLMLAIVFGLHLGGGCCDIYIAYLLTKKYKDERTLMNDTGPKMTLLVYDEEQGEEFDEATLSFIKEFEKTKKKDKVIKEKGSFVLSLICAVLFFLGALFSGGITIAKRSLLMLYEAQPPFYTLFSFYFAIACVLGIIYCLLTLKKHGILKLLIIIIFVVFSLPIILIITLQGSSGVSHTTDVANYGVYDYPYNMPDYFPAEITDDMIPLEYSYYYDNSWDWCYELYLEVKMTDSAFESYKSEYSEELVPCWYNCEYSEYVIDDDLNLDQSDDGGYYMNNPDIRKIIFNEDEKTIIFVAIYGIDPFYFENSVYFKKFKMDPIAYEEKTQTEMQE